MNRRSFIGTIGAVFAATSVAGKLGARETKRAAKRAAARSAKTGAMDVTQVPINLTDAPELDAVGGTYHLEYDDLQRDVLVVHVSKQQYVGVDLKCTHRACDVSYSPDEKNFYCPCHGSKFDLYGRVLVGPATAPLNYYHAERQGDEVMVTLFGASDAVPANCIPPPIDTTHARDTMHARDSTFH